MATDLRTRENDPDTLDDQDSLEESGESRLLQTRGDSEDSSNQDEPQFIPQPRGSDENQSSTQDTGGFVKKPLKKAASSSFDSKKVGLIAGGLGSLSVIFLIFILFAFIGQFKTIHFATVMRSAGFAQYNRVISRLNAQVIFDAATLTDSSTGVVRLGDRSLLQKLRGVNPEKRLTQLGREGTLKFDMEGTSRWGGLKTTNNFRGVEINGESFNLDNYSKDLFNKSYKDLSRRERWTVESRFSNEIRTGLADRLATTNLSFRSSVYNGLRQTTGIRMTKWVNRAKDYAGKNADTARELNVKETIENVNGEELKARKVSSLGDDEVKSVQDEAVKAAKEGRPAKPSPRVELAAKNAKNISDAAFLITVACIVHDLDNSFKEAAKQTELGSYRMGHDLMTASDQTQMGETNSEAVNAENSRWAEAESSPWYKQDIGQTLTEGDMLAAAKVPMVVPDSTFATLISYADIALDQMTGPAGLSTVLGALGLGDVKDEAKDKFCSVALNEYVQWGIAGGELVAAVVTLGGEKAITLSLKGALTATTHLALGMGVGELLGTLLDKAVQNFANLSYSGVATGPEAYSQTRMGVDQLQQAGLRKSTFGAPLSDDEAAANQSLALAELRNQKSGQSLHERYFALTNPYSLMGLVVANTPSNATQLANTSTGIIRFAISTITNPVKLVGSFATPLHGKASAATAATTITPKVAGIEQWGFTAGEMAKIDSDDSFSSVALEDYIGPQLDELDKKWMICYDPYLQSEISDECPKDELRSDLALHWRWYHALLDRATEESKPLSAFTAGGQ